MNHHSIAASSNKYYSSCQFCLLTHVTVHVCVCVCLEVSEESRSRVLNTCGSLSGSGTTITDNALQHSSQSPAWLTGHPPGGGHLPSGGHPPSGSVALSNSSLSPAWPNGQPPTGGHPSTGGHLSSGTHQPPSGSVAVPHMPILQSTSVAMVTSPSGTFDCPLLNDSGSVERSVGDASAAHASGGVSSLLHGQASPATSSSVCILHRCFVFRLPCA